MGAPDQAGRVLAQRLEIRPSHRCGETHAEPEPGSTDVLGVVSHGRRKPLASGRDSCSCVWAEIIIQAHRSAACRVRSWGTG